MTFRKMKLYGLGGAGTNIVTTFLKFAGKHTVGYCDIDCTFVDTSKSNLSPNIPNAQIYLLDGLDGSGKLRASNYAAIVECSKEILHMHKPGDINVVVTSGSGGSGSVLGPVLVSELLSRGETVIVITVGSTSSRIETENTLKTFKSYEMISQKQGKAVVMAYYENSSDMIRSEVDNRVETAVMMLAVLFSGNNRGLDTADLRNFINYDLVTSYKPKLSMLDFYTKDIVIGKGQALVTAATLADEGADTELGTLCEYQTVGYVPSAVKSDMSLSLPVHACVITGYFNSIVDRLETKLSMFDEARGAYVEKAIIKNDDKGTDIGVCL